MEGYTVALAVRDYELDQYRVVNNSVYLNYLEHARHEFLNTLGIDPAAVAQAGRALALAELQLAFRKPLVSGDRFQVTVAVKALTGARVVLTQRILREPGPVLILKATAVAAFLDNRGRPQRVPAAVRRALSPLVAG